MSAKVWRCWVLFHSRMRRSRKASPVAAYAACSSQLKTLRASVVSTWRTTSLSKPSLSLKPWVLCLVQASRWGSGMEAVQQRSSAHLQAMSRNRLGRFVQEPGPGPVKAPLFRCSIGARVGVYPPSTVLISPAPKPVKVLLCFGLEIPAGLTEPCMSTIGALVEGRRSLVGILWASVEAIG